MANQAVENTIQVVITRDTTFVPQTSFGTVLFIGETVLSPVIRVATYFSLDEVKAKFTAGTEPEFLAAQTFFSQGGNTKSFKIGYKASGETYTQALNAIRAVDDDFYAVTIQSIDKAVQTAFATTIAGFADEKIVFFRSDEAAIANTGTTDIASIVGATNNNFAEMFYHTRVYKPERVTGGLFPEVAYLGTCLTIEETNTQAPGSNNWVHRQLVGIPGDKLDLATQNILKSKNVCFIQDATNRTDGGTMLGGEKIDIIHGTAWLKTRIGENCYNLITSKADRNEKLPYTQAGINLLLGAVDSVIQRAKATNFITDEQYKVIPITETTGQDRSNRIYKGLSFTARYVGAINSAYISGVITN